MVQARTKNKLIITGLILTFVVYNITVYRGFGEYELVTLSEEALSGQKLWQDNNCWSCHQMYGLGGYLGPDLTNVISAKGKGENYVKAFLNSAVKSMPKFNFSKTEKEAIVAYLKSVDDTGYFPNYEAEIQASGWVKLKYKHEK